MALKYTIQQTFPHALLCQLNRVHLMRYYIYISYEQNHFASSNSVNLTGACSTNISGNCTQSNILFHISNLFTPHVRRYCHTKGKKPHLQTPTNIRTLSSGAHYHSIGSTPPIVPKTILLIHCVIYMFVVSADIYLGEQTPM